MKKDQIPKNPLLFGIFISLPHKKWAIAALSSVFVAIAVDRFSIIVLKNLTDSIASKPLDAQQIIMWGIAYPTIIFIAGLIWRLSGFNGMRWFMNIRFTAYQILYEYITQHSKDYFNSRFAGALANKIGNAVDGTESVYENLLWRFMPIVIGLGWYVIFAASSNAILGLIILIWSVSFLAINLWFAKKIRPRSSDFAKSISTLKGRIVDSLSNISLVHESAYLQGERNYIRKFVKQQRDSGLSEWQLSEWMLLTNNVLIFIFMALMVSSTIYLFIRGSISIGAVVMIVAIIGELTAQLFFIGMEIKNSTKYFGEAKEGLDEILSEHLIVDSPSARTIEVKSGEIEIESINFKYEDVRVFENFSVHIKPGEKVGFVGRSGAGKTTLTSLMLRHFKPNSGRILIDGHDIENITLESLRRAIAFVPQDISLFHRTILENIKYSNEVASDKETKEAARFAQADEFISKLPEDYNTVVGERGVKLSGGQRQRIAIARAFLKKAPIIILDEATSSLDTESEQKIQESLEKLMQGKTVIAVAHRLSTLKRMDRIIVIDNGKIVEDGSPDILLKNDHSKFKKMWNNQVSGFIVDG